MCVKTLIEAEKLEKVYKENSVNSIEFGKGGTNWLNQSRVKEGAVKLQ